MSESTDLHGLTGVHRKAVAEELWHAWQVERRAAAVITGVSGIGKTDRLVRPLVARARARGGLALHVEVPQAALSTDEELKSLVIQELRDCADEQLVSVCEQHSTFAEVAREVFRRGGLLVVDEFQRLLEPGSALPIAAWRNVFGRLGTRVADEGCLWLVSNREVSADWTEPFHQAFLTAPASVDEQIQMVLDALGTTDPDGQFPVARRIEVARRLGGNPRALRLLGNLLRTHVLDDMLGPAQATPEGPVDPALVAALERQLVRRAAEGLTPKASVLLEALTVLPDPAPWGLIAAVAGSDSAGASEELQSRYLLGAKGSRYDLHPVVRETLGPKLRAQEVAFREAHLRAGRWHARALGLALNRSTRDADIALRLSGARFHLLQANAPDELNTSLLPLQEYIVSTFGWSARTPTSTYERDGVISLLEAFLIKPGPAGIEFTYANLLKGRDLPGDAARALPHAQRATRDQDFSQPWVLWAKLILSVEGLEAAVLAAEEGAKRVAPDKNLFAVYQFWGACLTNLGRPTPAVNVLVTGAATAKASNQRLIEQAILCAASTGDQQLLQKIRADIVLLGSFTLQVALLDVIILEHAGRWAEAAALAATYRVEYPKYIHLCSREVLGHLGAADPESARAALAKYPIAFRPEVRSGVQWLISLVATQCNDYAAAAKHYSIYMNGTPPPAMLSGIRAALLREWDHRIGTIGEANPGLVAPILPKALTGLEQDMCRPQFGPPVLPQHHASTHSVTQSKSNALSVLAIATEWQSGRGGLSTLNRNLCLAFVRQGARVVCVVEPGSGPSINEEGVTVFAPISTPGQEPHEALTRRPELPAGFTPDIIIGHGRVTGPAASVLATDHFPQARRLHFVHMAPDEIEWLKGGREDDAGQRAEERTRIELELARNAARVVTIGPRLQGRFLRDLDAEGLPSPVRLDPGFDRQSGVPRQPPLGQPWAVLTMGRMEDANIKGLDIAAQAMGKVVRKARVAQNLELIVRGAPKGSGDETREQILEWAAAPGLEVLVRPYTLDPTRLEADLRRASLLLMPSRAEGFGLVGLEAIIAGTPVLISEESGLGQLLKEILSKEQAARHVVPITRDVAVDAESWANAIEAALMDRESTFKRAEELAMTLSEQRTWSSAIAGLIAELELPLNATA